jgi:hypothetical protein
LQTAADRSHPTTGLDWWDAEIVLRVQAYKRGEIETCAAEEVFAEARRIAP